MDARNAASNLALPIAVKGHGVDEDLIAEVFRQNKAFFDPPVEEKTKILADDNFRGYTPMKVSMGKATEKGLLLQKMLLLLPFHFPTYSLIFAGGDARSKSEEPR